MKTHREQLYRMFGADADLLANDLDVAARQYRAYAEHLLARDPDALITAAGAKDLAAGHHGSAQRCERIAETIRRTLADDETTTDLRHPAGGRR